MKSYSQLAAEEAKQRKNHLPPRSPYNRTTTPNKKNMSFSASLPPRSDRKRQQRGTGGSRRGGSAPSSPAHQHQQHQHQNQTFELPLAPILTFSSWIKKQKFSLDAPVVKISAVSKNITKFDLLPDRFMNVANLYLGNNFLDNIDQIVQFPTLRLLSLANNAITNFDALLPLAKCRHLESLYTQGNPISHIPNYRYVLLGSFPQLRELDGKRINDSERERGILIVAKQDKLLELMFKNHQLIGRLFTSINKLKFQQSLTQFSFGIDGIFDSEIQPNYFSEQRNLPTELQRFLLILQHDAADLSLLPAFRFHTIQKVHKKWMSNYRHLNVVKANNRVMADSWEAAFTAILSIQQNKLEELKQILQTTLESSYGYRLQIYQRRSQFSRSRQNQNQNLVSPKSKSSTTATHKTQKSANESSSSSKSLNKISPTRGSHERRDSHGLVEATAYANQQREEAEKIKNERKSAKMKKKTGKKSSAAKSASAKRGLSSQKNDQSASSSSGIQTQNSIKPSSDSVAEAEASQGIGLAGLTVDVHAVEDPSEPVPQPRKLSFSPTPRPQPQSQTFPTPTPKNKKKTGTVRRNNSKYSVSRAQRPPIAPVTASSSLRKVSKSIEAASVTPSFGMNKTPVPQDVKEKERDENAETEKASQGGQDMEERGESEKTQEQREGEREMSQKSEYLRGLQDQQTKSVSLSLFQYIHLSLCEYLCFKSSLQYFICNLCV